ncbi:hypothetical protein [Neptuniibacter sp. QD37_11]|uniref:hypothetical protein n=1 Tax=Neptuniibacter sp. QD37_11 TaxID=3398209 RepID=UPI0039F4C0B6
MKNAFICYVSDTAGLYLVKSFKLHAASPYLAKRAVLKAFRSHNLHFSNLRFTMFPAHQMKGISKDKGPLGNKIAKELNRMGFATFLN